MPNQISYFSTSILNNPPPDDWVVFGDHPPFLTWRDDTTEEEHNALMGHVYEQVRPFKWDNQLRFDF